MTLPDDIKLYLPKYLSDDSTRRLLENLKQFPGNIDDRFYTTMLASNKELYQGDGLTGGFPVINLPSEDIRRTVPLLIMTNSCDNDEQNRRKNYRPSISYCPILRLDKLEAMWLDKNPGSMDEVRSFVQSIREQKVTNVFYLPPQGAMGYESVVFFDKIISCAADDFPLEHILCNRVFTLSDYGFYVFLFKLSIHFTRIQEGVARS